MLYAVTFREQAISLHTSREEALKARGRLPWFQCNEAGIVRLPIAATREILRDICGGKL